MNQLCKKLNLGNYSSWSESEKISFLSKKINAKSKFINKNVYLDKENKETLKLHLEGKSKQRQGV